MKPREFWIDDSNRTQIGEGLAIEPNGWQSPAFTKPYYAPDLPFKNLKNIIHVREVVEISEAELEIAALRKERDELRAGIQNYKCSHCHSFTGPVYPVNLMTERDAYREALEKIVYGYALKNPIWDNAKEVLAKYKEKP